MAKKMMEGNCEMCHSDPCKCSAGCGYGSCGNRGCKIFVSLVIVVLGLLLIWPKGWFTYWHTLGLLVVLVGLWKLGHSCFQCK